VNHSPADAQPDHRIETNLEKLHTLARALLERESLDGEEIARLLRVPPLTGAPAPA
jgi:ATP-dependent Zn protease